MLETGRKNARETLLRAIMIYTAVEVMFKGADSAHALFTQELSRVLDSVLAAQEMELTTHRYNYVVAGVHTLINEEGFVREIAARWQEHEARLNRDDIRRCEEIFSKALSVE